MTRPGSLKNYSLIRLVSKLFKAVGAGRFRMTELSLTMGRKNGAGWPNKIV